MHDTMTGLLSGGRRVVAGLAIAGLLTASLAGAAAAEEIAAAGNGGTVDNSANGGAVSIGDTNDGGNTGATTVVADGIADGASAEEIIAMVYESLGLEVPE